ncbi:hypothetical protein DRO32_01815 [Candidatus Bathyarchaeota archaeon]|nr:MAG: hypothetical protein DRO32_01815 [Candidatus Bathyarchaeota archaeon]
MSEEKVERLAHLREILVKRVEELEAELSGLREVLAFVDQLLKELSFKRLSLPEEGPGAGREAGPEGGVAPPPGETVMPLTTVEGELLANMFVGRGYVRIVPADDKKFHASSRPFRFFLRQLKGMQDRDASLVAQGSLSPDEVVSFNVVKEGDVVKEILIKNVRPEDVKKLRSIARWAFRTMWDQMTGSRP